MDKLFNVLILLSPTIIFLLICCGLAIRLHYHYPKDENHQISVNSLIVGGVLGTIVSLVIFVYQAYKLL